MLATKAIKEIMIKQGMSNADLAKRIGSSNAVIYERLTQDNISVRTLDEMLRVIGYEIVIQPVTSGRRPNGVYVIDGGGR